MILNARYRNEKTFNYLDRSTQTVANQTILELLFSNYDKDVRPNHGGTYL